MSILPFSQSCTCRYDWLINRVCYMWCVKWVHGIDCLLLSPTTEKKCIQLVSAFIHMITIVTETWCQYLCLMPQNSDYESKDSEFQDSLVSLVLCKISLCTKHSSNYSVLLVLSYVYYSQSASCSSYYGNQMHKALTNWIHMPRVKWVHDINRLLLSPTSEKKCIFQVN